MPDYTFETWEYAAAWRLVEALEERNRIEKAKLADARARRKSYEIEAKLSRGDSPDHTEVVEYARASAAADCLTAEVLGEGKE